MTTGSELCQSNAFLPVAALLFPLAEEARQVGMKEKESEGGLLGDPMWFCCEQAFHGAVEAFEPVFRHGLSVDTPERVSQPRGVAADAFLQEHAAPLNSAEGSILVLPADGKGIPMVKSDAQRLRAFEEKAMRPGHRRMATVCRTT